MGYLQLDVWQRARKLVVQVYELVAGLPATEQFGISSQLRRAAISVPANIADGYGRKLPKAYVQFLRISKGSINEIETLVMLVEDLHLAVVSTELKLEISKIGSMLSNLIAKIERTFVKEDRVEYGEAPVLDEN